LKVEAPFAEATPVALRLPQQSNSGDRAISLALDTPFRDTDDCFRWLYSFGSTPLRLDITYNPRDCLTTPLQRARFARSFSPVFSESWENWVSPLEAGPPRYKVYVNSSDRSISETLSRLAAALCKTDGFKVVAKQWMAHRPDHLVAYFHDLKMRAKWCDKHRTCLTELSGPHVPFTERFLDCSAISIAEDPANMPGESWRSTLLQSVASDIMKNQGKPNAHQKVLEAVIARGINPSLWCRQELCRE